MQFSDNTISKDIKLLECQIEIILKSLELYAFNLNHTWGVEVDTEDIEIRKSILFHTYESLIYQKKDYQIGYEVEKQLKNYNKNNLRILS